MKFSEKWLREWVNPPVSTAELCEQLTMAGLEVDAVDSCRGDFSGVVVAKVIRMETHPQADSLSVCRLDTGMAGEVSVVCGADNVRVGGCYPLAGIGATLPRGRRIQATEIKGVTSQGMLCSGAELGLSEDAEGLLVLAPEAVPGTDLQQLLGLDDHTIELSLTPNRGDCFSIRGIARDIAVVNELDFSEPEIKPVAVVSAQIRAVSLPEPDACPVYVGRVIEGVQINRVSPTWLTEKLRRSGTRSINPIVDITNYILLELGQPMHAFDNDLLEGEISVRYAGSGEQITLLDGQPRELNSETLVIADSSRAVAMAGIMGGEETAVNSNTCNIFLESAYFSPRVIMGRAREYGLHTDSSHRFERGVDFELQRQAIERATQLILEICGGQPGPVCELREPRHLPKRNPVVLRAERVARLLGVEIERERITGILQRLGFLVIETGPGWEVTAPCFRFDIELEVDLIEEIARVYGYDNMPTSVPQAGMRLHSAGFDTTLTDLRRILVDRGYHEVITYSFVDGKIQEKLHDAAKAVPLLNPISSELGVMRQSLWTGLLTALEYNSKRQQQRLRLFEYGRIFNLEPELVQEPVISGIIYGNLFPEQWDIKASTGDFFDIKGDVEALIERIAGREVEYREIEHHALHPGQSAQILLDGEAVGLVGAVHPGILKALDISQRVFAFELCFSRISTKMATIYRKLSKFPSVRRDISILIDAEIAVDKVIANVKNTVPELLENLELFDLFQGEGIDLEKKSLALGLTFRGSSSTLIDGEVEEIMEKILEGLYSEFSATLRE